MLIYFEISPLDFLSDANRMGSLMVKKALLPPPKPCKRMLHQQQLKMKPDIRCLYRKASQTRHPKYTVKYFLVHLTVYKLVQNYGAEHMSTQKRERLCWGAHNLTCCLTDTERFNWPTDRSPNIFMSKQRIMKKLTRVFLCLKQQKAPQKTPKHRLCGFSVRDAILWKVTAQFTWMSSS